MTEPLTLTLPRTRMGRRLGDHDPNQIDEAFAECAEELIRIPGEIQSHGAMVCLNAAGRAIRASENCEAILGLPAHELVGRDLDEFFPAGDQPADRSVRRVRLAHCDPPREVEVAGHVVAGPDGAGERVLEFQPVDEAVGADLDAAGVVGRFVAAISGADDLDTLLPAAADAIRDANGFARVMIYRFDEDYNGAVVAESRREDLEPYLGLHYPASDIPPQARQLYLENRVRLLVDVDYEASPLLSQKPDSDPKPDASGCGSMPPLDMGHCLLRSMSPIHRRYLVNMGVRSSLSLSIVRDGRLWGLVACHHDEPRPLAWSSLGSLEVIAEVLSAKVALAEDAAAARRQKARFEIHRRVLDTCQSEADLASGLTKNIGLLADLVEADGVALWFGDEVTRYGAAPNRDAMTEILHRLRERVDIDLDQVFATDSLTQTLGEDVAAADPDSRAAGLMVMQFWPSDYILLFRSEQSYNVRWAGEPKKAPSRSGDGRLQPRSSFDEWVETVGGRALPWSATDTDAAAAFRSSLAVHIIRRAQELEDLNRQLRVKTEEVERFVYSVSHDLKAPLVTCQGFLGFLRDDLKSGQLEAATDSITRVERAVATMNSFIDDLLDFSRLGRDESETIAPVSLDDVLTQVLDQDSAQIAASGLQIRRLCTLPDVLGRRSDLIRVFENLITNAIKYAADDDPRIEIDCRGEPGWHRISFRDYGVGIPEQYHAKAMRLFQRVHTKKSGSGVGLATVAKVLESVGGSATLNSPEGGGLEVVLSFPDPDRG